MANRKRKCSVCNKMFQPTYDTPTVSQLVCSKKCCVKYYDGLKKKSRRIAANVAKMVGRRSMNEVRFDSENFEGKKNIIADYEPESFQYKVVETNSYTPDYKIQTRSGKTFFIELKGVLDMRTRKLMVRVRDQHPEIDIRFVFQKANNKIRRGSKTTYGMWADKNGFKWADNKIPKGWLK